MRKAVRVESNRKAILFVGAAGIFKLLVLAASERAKKQKTNVTYEVRINNLFIPHMPVRI